MTNHVIPSQKPYEIFRQLIQAIKNAQIATPNASTHITTFQILQFLLGKDYLEEHCLDTDEALNNLLYKGKYLPLLQDSFYKQINSNKWNLSYLDSDISIFDVKHLTTSLAQIYERTFLCHSLPTDYTEMIQDLVMYQIYGSRCVDSVLKSYTRSSKCPLYKSNMEDELISHIHSNYAKQNIAIISGPPYRGKSSLVQLYLEKYAFSYTEIVWHNSLSAESLRESINEIPFLYEPILKREVLPILCTKSHTTLLIIKRSRLNEEDLTFLNDYFCGRDIRILIITETAIPAEYDSCFSVNTLPHLSPGTLKKILIGTNSPEENFPLRSDKDFQKLFEIVDYNALILSILSKTLSHKSCPNLHDSLLDESNWLWSIKSLPKINCSYYPEDSGHNAKYYLLRILDFIDITPEQIPFLCELAVWTSSDNGCPTQILKTFMSNYNPSTLDYFVQNGLINTQLDYEINYYRIPAIMAQCICYEYLENSSERISILDSILKNIDSFIDACLLPGSDLIIPPTNLCDIIMGITMRLNPLISSENVRKKRDWNIRYEHWQRILSAFHTFMQYTGSIKTAEVLHQDYLYYYHPHLTRHERERSESWRMLRTSKTATDYAYLLFADFPQDKMFRFQEICEEYTIKFELLFQDKTARISLIFSTADLIATLLNIFFTEHIKQKDYKAIICHEETLYKLVDLFNKLNSRFPEPNLYITIEKSYFSMLRNYAKAMYSLQQNSYETAYEYYWAARGICSHICDITPEPQTKDILLKTWIYSTFFELQLILTPPWKNINTFSSKLSLMRIQNIYKALCDLFKDKLWSIHTVYAFVTLGESMEDCKSEI